MIRKFNKKIVIVLMVFILFPSVVLGAININNFSIIEADTPPGIQISQGSETEVNVKFSGSGNGDGVGLVFPKKFTISNDGIIESQEKITKYYPQHTNEQTFSMKISIEENTDPGLYTIDLIDFYEATEEKDLNMRLDEAILYITVTSTEIIDIIVVANPQTKIYGNNDPIFTFDIISGPELPEEKFNGELSRTEGEEVGIYNIKQGTLDIVDSKYNLIFEEADFEITKRPITVTADNKNKFYGDDDPSLTYVVTEGSLVFEDTITGALARAEGESVGTYLIGQGDLVINDNYEFSFAGANLTISPRSITVTADDQSKVYGDDDPEFTYKVTLGNLVEGDAFTGELSREQGENVGKYEIGQGSLALNNNYSLSFNEGELEITPRSITVTADNNSRVYGDDDPELTYKVTSGNLVEGDAFTGELSREQGENVGKYEIGQGSLALNNNYSLSFNEGELEITPRSITVTADNNSKVYGDDDPELSCQITEGSLAFDDGFEGNIVRAIGEDVDTYTITQGTLALNDNYNLQFVNGVFTITQRSITVTADNASKVYGDNDPELTYHITEGSLAFDDSFTGALTREEGKDVGTYVIGQGTLSISQNYVLSFIPSVFEITKREIYVFAEDKTKIYGADDPELTYYYDSDKLFFGDRFTGSLSRQEGELIGTYEIKQDSLNINDNYKIEFVPGVLNIIYGIDLLSPYNPEKDYKTGSTIPLRWQYVDSEGFAMDSVSADVTVYYRFILEGDKLDQFDINDLDEVQTPGKTSLSYNEANMTWHVNWQTKALIPGLYQVIIHSEQTGQSDLYYFEFK